MELVFAVVLAIGAQSDPAGIQDLGRAGEPPAASAPRKQQDPGLQEDPFAQRPELKEKEKEKKKEAGDFRVRVGLDFTYNSNITNLDDRDVDRLENGTRPDKFRISQPDDFIWSPWAEGSVALQIFDELSTAGLKVRGNFYQENSIASHGEVGVFFKHDPVDFEYELAPGVYKREHRNLDTNEFESAFYDEHQAELGVKFRLHEAVRARPFAGLRFRDFDAPFNHRDAVGYFFGGRVTGDVTEWLELFGEYELFLNDAFASGNQPDTSYLAHAFEFGAAVKPVKDVELGIRYRIELRDYSTNNDADPGHSGRTDDRRRFILGGAWRITKDLTFDVELRFTNVDTDLPNDPGATDEETSWERREYVLGLLYSF